MLSAKSLFQEILDNDESFRLFCSIAASGESQGGWENGRIAALVPPERTRPRPQDQPARRRRGQARAHFQRPDEEARPQPVEVPADTDYTMLLERHGIGLAHEKLKGESR
jgi:hypothetical protein